MNNSHHFWRLCEDMDVLLFFLAGGEVDVHLFHSSEPSESTSVHDYVSAKASLSLFFFLGYVP